MYGGKGRIAKVCGSRSELKKESVEERNNQNNINVGSKRVKQVDKLRFLVENYPEVFGLELTKIKYLTGGKYKMHTKRVEKILRKNKQ